MRVIVVGGGWAGLAAAVELAAAGAEVVLLEAAAHLGGRARAVEHHGLRFDNGQHLLIGAYRETLRLLARCGVAEERVFTRRPLHWLIHGTAAPVEIAAPRTLPAPLHMLWALLAAHGYDWRERLASLRACAAVLRGPAGTGDISVRAWLHQTRQPPRVIETLWSPLCLAALNTPIDYASAEVYTRVLRDAFLERRSDADLLIARCDLGAVFPEPAAGYLTAHGARLHLGERVTGLIVDAQQRVRGVRSRRGEHTADHVVLAVPPAAAAALIGAVPALTPLATQLAAFGSEPICTAYLRYASPPPLAAPMIGLVGGHGQWVFDLGACGKPGWVAVVISGPGAHMQLDNARLLTALAAELAALWGAAVSYVEGFVIREKRATFSCRVGINAARPAVRTAAAGLWLAGDYTAAGYPATLEGAVRSGLECARAIVHAQR